jgi:hypothetical protein
MQMTQETRIIYVEGYGDIMGVFEHNQHGWFAQEVNGIGWDYRLWGVQAASATPEAAAEDLLRHAEETEPF